MDELMKRVERPVCLRCVECGRTLCARADDGQPAVLELLRAAAAHDKEHRLSIGDLRSV